MKIFNRIITLVIVLAIAGVCIFGSKYVLPLIPEGFFDKKPSNNQTSQEVGAKSITITIEDRVNDTVLLEATVFKTDAETLGELLMENEEKLKVVVSEPGEYGRTIYGLMDVVTEDWNVGPWWMFESDDSECCTVNGFCPAMDDCTIVDGESYTFFFMAY